ncbi:MAG: recombination mediator RecR [Alphaproteobacteria bacterium]
MSASEIENLASLLAKLPGLGSRSAKRIVLHLMSKKESLFMPLLDALQETIENVKPCTTCGNLDTVDPCQICTNEKRDARIICIVESVADLWALERAGSYKGGYHVLGGTLSAIDGVRPEDLMLDRLVQRTQNASTPVTEIILAMNATVEGQITAHYIIEQLKDTTVEITKLAHGVPLGGELDYMDDGTLSMALSARKPFEE